MVLSAHLSEAKLLKYLLGAAPAHRRPWRWGVELVVPPDVPAVWRRWLVSQGALTAEQLADTLARVPGDLRQEHLVELKVDGWVAEYADPFDDHIPGAVQIAGVDKPVSATAWFHDEPTGASAPRLPNAKVSYTELHDLRLAFRRIDAPVRNRKTKSSDEQTAAPWRAQLKRALTSLDRISASHPDALARGSSDARFGLNTAEAQAYACKAARDDLAQGRSRVTPILGPFQSRFGFGTIPDPVADGREFRKPAAAAAFVSACRSVQVTSPSDIAAIAALEPSRGRLAKAPSILRDREAAIRYWAKRKSETA